MESFHNKNTHGDVRPLVLHVVYRFDTGGLENGVANLINHMPEGTYRHAVLAMTEITGFRQRVERNDVELIALRKPPGQGFWQYGKIFKLMRELRPAIVHSRNLAALEVQVPAWAAGVPIRIHGEHGRDMKDLDGSSFAYQRIRRLYKPFVQQYVALSKDLANYLIDKVDVPRQIVAQVYNGVDTECFYPSLDGPLPIVGCPFDPAQHWLIGTVGRMQDVKNHAMLAHAFVKALALAPALRARLRLIIVGEGPSRAQVQAILSDAGLVDLAWLPGERNDVADVMRGFHVFVLPSLAEGISNTILEAMACSLPVIATAVGGNSELVIHGQTGYILPASNATAMAERLVRLASNPLRCHRLGRAGRQRALDHFSMQSMVSAYQCVYDQQMRRVRLDK
jgi:sugar transferase (PEP-CTERM/EpsH1 system associated)